MSEELERYCELSHIEYERVAKKELWLTNKASQVDWVDVPEANKIAMRASISLILSTQRAEIFDGIVTSFTDRHNHQITQVKNSFQKTNSCYKEKCNCVWITQRIRELGDE